MIKFSEFLEKKKVEIIESVEVEKIDEADTLGKAGEKWVKANIDRFKERYGKKYEKILFDKAKELFGSE